MSEFMKSVFHQAKGTQEYLDDCKKAKDEEEVDDYKIKFKYIFSRDFLVSQGVPLSRIDKIAFTEDTVYIYYTNGKVKTMSLVDD